MFFLSEFELEALKLSVRAALWGTGCTLPFAFALAWMTLPPASGKRRSFLVSLADIMIHLPMVLPPVAVGYGLLLLFGRRGILGEPLTEYFGFSFAFSWRGAALAAGVMGLPLMVRSIRLALAAIDPALIVAARTLGASWRRILFSIILPLSAPGILTGAVLGLARALGEFGATIAFVSNIPGETRTLPLALYTALQVPGGEWTAARLAIISLIFAWGALYGAQMIDGILLARRRKFTRSGVRRSNVAG